MSPARPRHPLHGFVIAALTALLTGIACVLIRPDTDGIVAAVFGGFALFAVLVLLLWNAGWRFGLWFRQSPDSPSVFLPAKQHPAGCVVMLWLALAAILTLFGCIMFGPRQ